MFFRCVLEDVRFIARRINEVTHVHAEEDVPARTKGAFENVEPFLKTMCMERRAMVWRRNVLQDGDGARQISPASLTHISFPNLSLDRTTRHAFSGAYDPLRGGCGLKRLVGHGNGRLPRHLQ